MNFLQHLSVSVQQARKIYTSFALLNTISVLFSIGYSNTATLKFCAPQTANYKRKAILAKKYLLLRPQTKTPSTHLEGVFLLHKLYRHISQYLPRTLLIL